MEDAEGLDQVDRDEGMTALIGLRDGMQFTTTIGPRNITPDSGWAAHEIGRLAAFAAPYGWIYGSHIAELDIQRLRRALEEVGGEPMLVKRGNRAVVLRIRFPRRDSVPGGATRPE